VDTTSTSEVLFQPARDDLGHVAAVVEHEGMLGPAIADFDMDERKPGTAQELLCEGEHGCAMGVHTGTRCSTQAAPTRHRVCSTSGACVRAAAQAARQGP
jgi:hypothetical protein